ncbi:MAG: hypothetical protein H0V82_02510 [Candidatus Protochlamydia sp.]|nr:hypothetical protein [Candidatus Protochlamydia sp.]
MDTSPNMEKKREMLGAIDPVERLKMGCSMYHTSRSLIEHGILERNPSISDDDFIKELFIIYYRDDFFSR